MQGGTLPPGRAGATQRAALAQALQASRLLACVRLCSLCPCATSALMCLVLSQMV